MTAEFENPLKTVSLANLKPNNRITKQKSIVSLHFVIFLWVDKWQAGNWIIKEWHDRKEPKMEPQYTMEPETFMNLHQNFDVSSIYKIWRDSQHLTRFHKISWDLTFFHKISQDVKLFWETSQDITRLFLPISAQKLKSSREIGGCVLLK